jgi:LuxR family maltose regulon positive regulatory protein
VKVTVPSVPSQLVSRPRLLAALDQAGTAATTLICAPAGSGKTLLLTEWVRRPDGIGTAWLSLAQDDNDDHRFWSGVLAAIAACPAVPDDNRLRSIPIPAAQPSRDTAFLGEVVDGLAALPAPIRLVLDDLHELVHPDPLHGVQNLLRSLPAGLRLILSTRQDPPLPLARLRNNGALRELRAAELRFSVAEAGELLAAAGLAAMRPHQVSALVRHTDGWAAGVRLAALSLAGAHDMDRSIAEFAGNNRALADYLLEEVLSRLPQDTQEFLRTISICEQVSASLAGVLADRDDAGALLNHLEHQTSMVLSVAAGRRWYRIHALLRAHLLADLRRRTPNLVPVLHRRAADWFDQQQQPAEALAHATDAADPAYLTARVSQHGPTLVLSGAHNVVQRALAGLGEPAVTADPALTLLSALLHSEAGQPATATALLTHAEAAWPPHPAPELETLRQMIKAPSCDAPAVRAALTIARDNQHTYLIARCLIALARFASTSDDYSAMVRLAAEAEELIGDRTWKQTATTAAALLAHGAFLRADPEECLRWTTRAAHLIASGVRPTDPAVPLLVGGLTGAALFDRGDRAAGLRHLRKARLAAETPRLPAPHAALVAMLEHRAASQLGDRQAARDVLSWTQQTLPDSGELLIMRARSRLLSGGSRRLAHNLLRPVLAGTVPPVLSLSLIKAWLLEAQISLSAEETTQAHRAIDEAVALAESLNVSHPLVFAPPDLAAQLPHDNYAAHLNATRNAPRTRPAPVALTKRERTVLQLLPTLRSRAQIADHLTLSTHTVKTHIHTIYQKLGVNTRRDAITAAQQAGLLLLEASAEPTEPTKPPHP